MDKEVKRIIISFVPGLIFVGVLWLIWFAGSFTGWQMAKFGVFPRDLNGATGILTSPFIHGSLEHLVSNSVPLLVLGAGLFYFYKSLAFRVFMWVYLLGGFWLWLGGRASWHIGASGVVYGLTTFLFFSGMIRRDVRLMALSLLVVFLYGGMVWGIFPLFKEISWEAHLYGSLAGILMAVVFRREGPQRKLYEWEKPGYEEEEEEEDDENAYWKLPTNEETKPTEDTNNPLKIEYIYRPSKPGSSSGDLPDNNEKN